MPLLGCQFLGVMSIIPLATQVLSISIRIFQVPEIELYQRKQLWVLILYKYQRIYEYLAVTSFLVYSINGQGTVQAYPF